MERAIFFTKLPEFEKTKIASKYKRIYFGNEFCQNLIPAKEAVKSLLRYIKNRKIDLTFVTPFVTDKGLDKLRKIFLFLNDNYPSTEVVVNDWGVLWLINREFGRLKPILGRLMFRLKRDPRIPSLIKGSQKSVRFKDTRGNIVIVLPKPMPEALKEAYCKSNFDFYAVRDFLLSHRVNRIEVDNLTQGLLLDLPKGISGSIYVPFGYLTVTRYCPAEINSPKGERRIGECDRECQKYFWKMRSACMPKVIYKKGNTQFYKCSNLSIKKWEKMGIDRLIFEPELPV